MVDKVEGQPEDDLVVVLSEVLVQPLDPNQARQELGGIAGINSDILALGIRPHCILFVTKNRLN